MNRTLKSWAENLAYAILIGAFMEMGHPDRSHHYKMTVFVGPVFFVFGMCVAGVACGVTESVSLCLSTQLAVMACAHSFAPEGEIGTGLSIPLALALVFGLSDRIDFPEKKQQTDIEKALLSEPEEEEETYHVKGTDIAFIFSFCYIGVCVLSAHMLKLRFSDDKYLFGTSILVFMWFVLYSFSSYGKEELEFAPRTKIRCRFFPKLEVHPGFELGIRHTAISLLLSIRLLSVAYKFDAAFDTPTVLLVYLVFAYEFLFAVV
jgi:hypothetical protein